MVLGLMGCGFTPLYSEHKNQPIIASELTSVEVLPISDRLGREVRNGLLKGLNPSAKSAPVRFRLGIRLYQSSTALAIEQDDFVTRQNYLVTADFTLTDIETGKVVIRGRSQSTAGINVVDSQYSNMAATRDVERRTAYQVSQDITLRLAAFFKREATKNENKDTPPLER